MPTQCKFDQNGTEMFCADVLFGSKFFVLNTNTGNGAVSHSVPDLTLTSGTSFPFAVTN
jgi:hypothetical protein